VFLAVHGFDESLPYVHDADFCWRVQLAGVPLQFVADATHDPRPVPSGTRLGKVQHCAPAAVSVRRRSDDATRGGSGRVEVPAGRASARQRKSRRCPVAMETGLVDWRAAGADWRPGRTTRCTRFRGRLCACPSPS
jgi:hypothetical protein